MILLWGTLSSFGKGNVLTGGGKLCKILLHNVSASGSAQVKNAGRIKNNTQRNMSDNLPVLRAKLDMTQQQLALLLGVSRQTVISIETKKREMTWNTFLSLVFVFSKNRATAELMRLLIFTQMNLTLILKILRSKAASRKGRYPRVDLISNNSHRDKHWFEVIKNISGGDCLVWRHPVEDFNTSSTLVVMPGRRRCS
jgi:DNA-binding XRE family transcriptional regulator